MKKELKKGDRVRVFSRHESFKGTVEEMTAAGSVFVIEDGFYSCHNDAPFHPKQCRRLKPKKKPEPVRERVTLVYQVSGSTGRVAMPNAPDGEYTLTEIREGELIVDELMLGTAMDDCGDTVFRGVGNALMKMFIKELRKYQGVSMKGEGA